MKKLTKGLLLLSVCLPLVSFAQEDCPSISKLSKCHLLKTYKVLKCANNGLYIYADIHDKREQAIGFMDSYGLPLPISPSQGRLHSFHDGMSQAIKKIDGIYKIGFVDTNGDLAIPHEYDMAFDFLHGYAIIAIGDFSDMSHLNNGAKWDVIDKKGKTVIPFKFDGFRMSYDGISGFTFLKHSKEDKWQEGFIDMKGNIIVEPH